MRSGGVQGPGPRGVQRSAQAEAPPSERSRGKVADPVGAANLVKLSDGLATGFPDRVFGTQQGLEAAQWVADQMKAAGLQGAVGGSFLQEFNWKIGDELWPGQNVVGLLPGSDPKLKNEYVIVTAHHDSQQGTSQGANDNASGCAAVIAIAQALAKDPPKRSVLFVTFDGEEGLVHQDKNQPGRRGSKHYAKNPVVPLAKTALMVNMDMIGQVHLESGSRKDIHQWASRDDFARSVLAKASAKTIRPGDNAVDGYPEQHDQAQMFTTDAEPLYRLGVPIVNFLSGRDLDNHAPEDDMRRLIPERMEQYGRLAHQCVVEAANHPESLQVMGITPGGLMPTYPLIRAQKSSGLQVHDEEALRLDDLGARLPELKAAAQKLVATLPRPELEAQAGVRFADLAGPEKTLLSEAALNRVRELRAEVVAAHREIPKGQVAERAPLLERLDALSGIEDVLAGAIYLAKIEKGGAYYLQQIPERLGDLLRGARRLGLDAQLEGVVLEKDVKAFAPEVSADRAVAVAKQSLKGLGEALGIAVFGLVDPHAAALDERAVTSADAEGLRASMLQTARQILGARGEDTHASARVFISAMLDAQVGGVKGSGAKWLERFADKNAFAPFVELVSRLELPDAQVQDLTARAKTMTGALRTPGAEEAVLDFYGALTAVVFGDAGRVRTLEDLRSLAKPGEIGRRIELGRAAEQQARDREVLGKAGDRPAVAVQEALGKLVARSLDLAALYDPKRQTVRPDASLREVKEKIDAIRTQARATPGGEPVAAELDFWSRWLEPFLPLEGRAKDQAQRRTSIATKGLAEARGLWPRVAASLDPRLALDPKQLGSAKATIEALVARLEAAEKAGDKDVRAELALARVEIYADVENALSTLVSTPSPLAEANLRHQIPALADHVGEKTMFGLKSTLVELERLHALDDVQMGRKDRGGPLGILAVRAAQQRGEG